MKKNDLSEVKKMDAAALLGRAQKVRNEIAGLIIDKNMNKLTNLKQISSKKKELARALTILKQKQLLEVLEKRGASA